MENSLNVIDWSIVLQTQDPNLSYRKQFISYDNNKKLQSWTKVNGTTTKNSIVW